jgi:uncharacterized membrane protein
MTYTQKNQNTKDVTLKYSRTLYGAFVAVSVYFLLDAQWQNAMSNMGIALIFDPFNQQVTWKDRPAYQKIWLIVHVTMVCFLLAVGLFKN